MTWYNTRRVAGFDAANAVFGLLPRRLSYVFITIVAWVVATILPGRVAGLRANLRHAFPDMSERDMDRLVMANAKNYGKFWVDLFKVPRLSMAARTRLLRVDGIENRDHALAAGNGALVVSIHMGAWEGCTAFWREQTCRTGLIAEVLEPPALWKRVRRLREKSGVEMVPLGRTAPRHIMRILKDNGLVAGAMDRDIIGSGKPYRLFDGTIKVPTGMVELAQRTGSPILPVICLREPDDSYRVVGHPPFAVEPGPAGVDRAIDRIMRTMEGWIRQYPDQWHVMEPLWRDQDAAAVSEPALEEAVG